MLSDYFRFSKIEVKQRVPAHNPKACARNRKFYSTKKKLFFPVFFLHLSL